MLGNQISFEVVSRRRRQQGWRGAGYAEGAQSGDALTGYGYTPQLTNGENKLRAVIDESASRHVTLDLGNTIT